MESVAHESTETGAAWTGPMEVERALERVYRDRLEAFVRVAAAIAGDRDVARDAVQDGFARVHSPTPGSFAVRGPWRDGCGASW